jgi:phosphopantothenoylcysteine decarboxylase/phosphopantothenate--cysteine ligase
VRILITSGGTREPIDAVRHLGNASTGRTGALIAEEAVRRYHTTYLLSGAGSVLPAAWARATGILVEREYGSTSDLLARIEELVAKVRFDAIVAAAAVADYTVQPVPGKIPSTHPELTLRLVPTPKVVDRLRQLAPDARLVVFKLEAGVTQEDLVRRATATLGRVGAAFAVANLAEGMGSDGHVATLVSRSGRVLPVTDRRGLAASVMDWLEQEVA